MSEIRAVSKLSPGDEICISYLWPREQTRAARQARLASQFQFHCACELCSAESAMKDGDGQRLRELEAQIDDAEMALSSLAHSEVDGGLLLTLLRPVLDIRREMQDETLSSALLRSRAYRHGVTCLGNFFSSSHYIRGKGFDALQEAELRACLGAEYAENVPGHMLPNLAYAEFLWLQRCEQARLYRGRAPLHWEAADTLSDLAGALARLLATPSFLPTFAPLRAACGEHIAFSAPNATRIVSKLERELEASARRIAGMYT